MSTEKRVCVCVFCLLADSGGLTFQFGELTTFLSMDDRAIARIKSVDNRAATATIEFNTQSVRASRR